MKKVQVLLSAYNGEKYLREQLDSILSQQYKNITLLIRDDGSTDGTLDILEEYKRNYENVAYYAGENIGIQNSFFELMKMADKDADYYAFSDQDDVWLPGKIERAVAMLEREEQEQPLLYGGKVIYANENLEIMETVPFRNLKEPGIGNALVENIFTGCTEVFNRELLEKVTLCLPTCEILHDWWLYMCGSCFGKVIYDQEGYILYRQHSHNQVGMQSNWTDRWKKRMHSFAKLKYTLSEHAKEFIKVYGVEYEKYETVLLVAEYRKNIVNRYRLITSKQIYRQQKIDDIIYRFLFLLGLL